VVVLLALLSCAAKMSSRGDTFVGDSGGILEQNERDSGVENVISSRQRPQWTSIWRTTAPDTLAEFRTTLPTHAVDKINQVGCTINHLLDRNYDLHRCSHSMRSQMVPCRSKRCKKQQGLLNAGSGPPPTCPCRYKVKLCLSSSTCEVFQQGDHAMDINDPPTPVERQLTQEMKEYILESLSGGEKTSASRLHSLLNALVDDRAMAGPAPKTTQVADFVKNWRRQHPKDSMAPLIALCEGHLYDQIDVASYADTEMVILCDTQSTQDESDEVVSHLGDGSSTYPLRVGMTCLRLVRDYVAVQSRPETTTILHLDSTHSMVINLDAERRRHRRGVHELAQDGGRRGQEHQDQGLRLHAQRAHGLPRQVPIQPGHGHRDSMFVELEKLGEDMHTLEAVGLQRRGSASVHSAAIRGTRDIFNKARIGKSEVEFVQTMIDGVTKLIELEKEPETGESYTDVLARVSTRKPHMEAVSSRWSEAKRVSQSSRRFPRGY
jgi:hypothetical protein